jgi:hypothetical protein
MSPKKMSKEVKQRLDARRESSASTTVFKKRVAAAQGIEEMTEVFKEYDIPLSISAVPVGRVEPEPFTFGTHSPSHHKEFGMMISEMSRSGDAEVQYMLMMWWQTSSEQKRRSMMEACKQGFHGVEGDNRRKVEATFGTAERLAVMLQQIDAADAPEVIKNIYIKIYFFKFVFIIIQIKQIPNNKKRSPIKNKLPSGDGSKEVRWMRS